MDKDRTETSFPQELSERESSMINSLRVFCIFFMIYAHADLGKGGEAGTILQSDSLAWVSVIWVDLLSRASVAALSFVSGFLIVRSLDRGRPGRFIRGRAQVLVVPMIFWNCVFIVLAVLAHLAGVESSAGGVWQPEDPMSMVNAVTGLAGPMVAPSLGFLRDLFVTSAIIALAWPWIRPVLPAVIAVVLAAALFDALEPVVFRPSIPFFMLAGAYARSRGWRLTHLASPRLALPVAAASAVLVLALGLHGLQNPQLAEASNLAKRAGLIALVLCLAAQLADTRAQAFCDRLAPVSYLAYLSHVRVLSVLFFLLAIDPGSSAFLAFFFLAPVIGFAAALVMTQILAVLPPWVARFVQGKAPRRRTPRPATA